MHKLAKQKLILTLAISLSLSACGAGQLQPESNATATILQAPVQSAQNEHSFVVSFQGQNGDVEGYGQDSKEAAYDAIAYMASSVWKAGTQAYRDMLTDKGLSVLLLEKGSNKAFHAVVKMTKQGLVIDVVAV